eukprot:6315850-Pyramimonas_sp.AAC.1
MGRVRDGASRGPRGERRPWVSSSSPEGTWAAVAMQRSLSWGPEDANQEGKKHADVDPQEQMGKSGKWRGRRKPRKCVNIGGILGFVSIYLCVPGSL